MSAIEMKWEITRRLDKLSDAKLSKILDDIVADENQKQSINWDITANMDELFQENIGLLKRLAQ